MSRYCEITYKEPMSGHNVSHSKRRTNRRFLLNLQTKVFHLYNEEGNIITSISLRVSTAGIRIIDKLGIEQALLYAQKQKLRESQRNRLRGYTDGN